MKNLTNEQKKAFWSWWKKDKTFTMEEVELLLENIKVFNAGAIDDYLTNHVDKCFENWKKSYEE